MFGNRSPVNYKELNSLKKFNLYMIITHKRRNSQPVKQLNSNPSQRFDIFYTAVFQTGGKLVWKLYITLTEKDELIVQP